MSILDKENVLLNMIYKIIFDRSTSGLGEKEEGCIYPSDVKVERKVYSHQCIDTGLVVLHSCELHVVKIRMGIFEETERR